MLEVHHGCPVVGLIFLELASCAGRSRGKVDGRVHGNIEAEESSVKMYSRINYSDSRILWVKRQSALVLKNEQNTTYSSNNLVDMRRDLTGCDQAIDFRVNLSFQVRWP